MTDQTVTGAGETFEHLFSRMVAAGTGETTRQDRMALMSSVMDLMRDGEWRRIDAGLASVDPAALSEISILTLLRSTYSSKDVLACWAPFRDRAGDVLAARGVPVEQVFVGLGWVPAGEREPPACDPSAPASERMRAALDALASRFRRRDLDDATAAMREMAASGDPGPVDAALAATEPEMAPELLTIMLLRGTEVHREALPSWDGLLERAHRAFAAKGYPADHLLRGLGRGGAGPA